MHKRALALSIFLSLAGISSAYAAGILYRDNGTEPPTLDPQLASDNSASQVLHDTFEGLTALGTFFVSGLYLCHGPKFAARCSVYFHRITKKKVFLAY